MASDLQIHSIVSESIVDGPGIRMAIFVQGCPHHCPGCHNPQTHDFYGGQFIDVSSVFKQYKENPLLRGITFSGGEPFCQAAALAELGALVKQAGGTVVGIGAVVEKGFQGGSDKLRKAGCRVESLAVIDRIDDGKIIFR